MSSSNSDPPVSFSFLFSLTRTLSLFYLSRECARTHATQAIRLGAIQPFFAVQWHVPGLQEPWRLDRHARMPVRVCASIGIFRHRRRRREKRRTARRVRRRAAEPHCWTAHAGWLCFPRAHPPPQGLSAVMMVPIVDEQTTPTWWYTRWLARRGARRSESPRLFPNVARFCCFRIYRRVRPRVGRRANKVSTVRARARHHGKHLHSLCPPPSDPFQGNSDTTLANGGRCGR